MLLVFLIAVYETLQYRDQMKFQRLTLSIVFLFVAKIAMAQEMEPRAYSPSPIGTQFTVVSYGHQSGDVLLDASLPLKDVSIKLNAASFGYGRSFNLAGRQANVAVL